MGSLKLTDVNGQKHVSATNARINFGALIDYIKETGESVVIDRRGKPPVRAVPWTKENLEKALDEQRRWRKAEGIA